MPWSLLYAPQSHRATWEGPALELTAVAISFGQDRALTRLPAVDDRYLVATYAMPPSDHSNVIFLLNTFIVVTLVIAKLPLLHQVRIFGINA